MTQYLASCLLYFLKQGASTRKQPGALKIHRLLVSALNQAPLPIFVCADRGLLDVAGVEGFT
jgi:hypothetical protein